MNNAKDNGAYDKKTTGKPGISACRKYIFVVCGIKAESEENNAERSIFKYEIKRIVKTIATVNPKRGSTFRFPVLLFPDLGEKKGWNFRLRK